MCFVVIILKYRLLQKTKRLFRFAVTTEAYFKNFTISGCIFVCRVNNKNNRTLYRQPKPKPKAPKITQNISKKKMQNEKDNEKYVYFLLVVLY